MINDDAIEVLNHLIEICKDGEKGYWLAAENEKKAGLSEVFRRFSEERAQLLAELKQEVRKLGGDPEYSGAVLGSLRRRWMEAKSIVTGDDTEAIVRECERNEDVAKNVYQEALKNELPVPVFEVVQRQYEQIKATYDQMRSLELQHHK